MATEPLLAVLLLGQLGFAPWQYTLAFAALTALSGVLATVTSTRAAIAAAGAALLATPLLLPRRDYPPQPDGAAAAVAGRVTAG